MEPVACLYGTEDRKHRPNRGVHMPVNQTTG